MQTLIAGISDAGLVKEVNQDCCYYKTYSTSVGDIVFAIVCDGVGGLSYGEIASSIVVHEFASWIDRNIPSADADFFEETNLSDCCEEILALCHQRILDYGVDNGGISLGTTATLMILVNDYYFVSHVGDTRVYILTNNSLRIVTKDQTVLQSEIDKGLQISEEEVETDKRSHILLQCVGARKTVEPTFYSGHFESNTVFMICCDGFRHRVSRDELFNLLAPEKIESSEQISNVLTQVVECIKQRGEKDNITSVVIKVIY